MDIPHNYFQKLYVASKKIPKQIIRDHFIRAISIYALIMIGYAPNYPINIGSAVSRRF